VLLPLPSSGCRFAGAALDAKSKPDETVVFEASGAGWAPSSGRIGLIHGDGAASTCIGVVVGVA
jgi:hypothetical protein